MEQISKDESVHWMICGEAVCLYCVTEEEKSVAGAGMSLEEGSKYICKRCRKLVLGIAGEYFRLQLFPEKILDLCCGECAERLYKGIPEEQIKAELKDKMPSGLPRASSDTGFTCYACKRWIPLFPPKLKRKKSW